MTLAGLGVSTYDIVRDKLAYKDMYIYYIS